MGYQVALHAPFLSQHHAGFKTLAALAEIRVRAAGAAGWPF